ncbi:hypothetical protein B0T18DRAFT_26331 [Schizothecium vesticola]|uniref:Secreted protein n=1 Tax=Schizothecium vesticola TaxID=314040 RepID=A0AA40KCB2_9PEZI|nr:hypothetical protein B0T18DRAFT_26331 [Schizothecium vesticola]
MASLSLLPPPPPLQVIMAAALLCVRAADAKPPCVLPLLGECTDEAAGCLLWLAPQLRIPQAHQENQRCPIFSCPNGCRCFLGM